MATTITCPKCGESFEITQAFKHEIEEELKTKIEEKANIENENLKKELDEARQKQEEFRVQELKLREKNRKVEEREKNLELEFQRKMDEERNLIIEKTLSQASEEHNLKDQEKDKKLQDALRMNEELKKKLEQGSQQTQGEVLELEIEEVLRKEFPNDEIKEVAKGVRGADIIQKVKDKMGKACGLILWESKNAKWSETWIPKLKEDQRQAKADIAVLVSVNLPEEIKSFAYKGGTWVCSRATFAALASALRINLYQVFTTKQSAVGKNEKMEILYEYLSGVEFRHRVEGIVEAFSEMQEDIEREKRWFTSKWAKQEKSLRKVMDQTHGMYGELESMMGKSLAPIKSLELEDGRE